MREQEDLAVDIAKRVYSLFKPVTLPPPPVAREDVQEGRRVCKRYRQRLGTLVCVARCADQWPVLLVEWDDEPEYVSRVVNYDVTLWLEQEGR